jgi:hypothetical protein
MQNKLAQVSCTRLNAFFKENCIFQGKLLHVEHVAIFRQSWPKVRRTTKQISNFLIYLGFKIILHLPPLPHSMLQAHISSTRIQFCLHSMSDHKYTRNGNIEWGGGALKMHKNLSSSYGLWPRL